jgi:hypothetical protein
MDDEDDHYVDFHEADEFYGVIRKHVVSTFSVGSIINVQSQFCLGLHHFLSLPLFSELFRNPVLQNTVRQR